jgi:endonuclease III
MRLDDAFAIMWAVLGFAALAICVDVLVYRLCHRRGVVGRRVKVSRETAAQFDQ